MKNIFFLLSLLLSQLLYSQNTTQESPIQAYGSFYEVEQTDFKTDTSHPLKVVFEVGRSFDDASKPNPLIETAARYINMHYNAGVALKNLEVALVIHGSASKDILKDEKYAQKNDGIKTNSNTALITALAEKGVKIILCGQTAAYHNITKTETLPEVEFALSAMTALVQLQNDGYRLISF
ncbi:DsrE family protein [Gillisia sp. M10.2A]|uniref:DsrE family protein n=1 Tax=Gillisia lutea TaxID=2909668 RepID=A0ABS9EEG1_9FLAO|nr:DsrE family protein [Gillisia lutea]MCF4101231.1 DsrE family protein [Gillisia lutea]